MNGKNETGKNEDNEIIFQWFNFFNRYIVIIKSRLVAGKDLCPYPVIRECGSTPYVGLAHAVPSSNTNFRLTLLLTRLQEAFYEDLPV